ncbi:uncharacterized protein SPAPADRAFT_139029 [Spathaspora passalidarum NRRL Y-27907]|uniref:Myotubularin phosphatase domain-containing protein n=1 Tax=Spathaspora passalidarum (strain NRRL Y-27907 / 11-Y1) TaxID=619300 RepID=G3APU7_SPAPN|nr:uncharacterized protein SPAPADRAFT_139029 [Spathaspora passalidarum NRRL Y-27907]EGW32268.1 hypothetical protein SPAPADRAFT_139029 [Spathaspora passalidarum NRRL Y-27907]
MDPLKISTVNDVILNRRGYHIRGTLILSTYHLVFSFTTPTSSTPREIWICYPIIDRMSKARGSSWMNNVNGDVTTPPVVSDEFDHYSASHIRLQCKDFTFYSFDFLNDAICCEVFAKMSSLITVSKSENDIKALYAYEYRPNMLEQALEVRGWDLYDPVQEYTRLNLIENEKYWRVTNINEEYKFCPSYPKVIVVPSSISDNVLKHAGKFRSKQRIPAIVYKHRGSNGNVIARCAQPLVGLNLQNRSIQDEKLIGEIFKTQQEEREYNMSEEDEYQNQPQRNLLVDLRPLTNAIGQHALGAGTENVENYRGKTPQKEGSPDEIPETNLRHVEKIFCNIDNIHVMRDSVNKLTSVLNDLDKYPTGSAGSSALLQQQLTKTQWLHRLSLILQSVDRITKSIHFNNTNVIIHCSDGWDRTSQVSALAQLCLDPYYRTIKGFMVLIEKEWVSFGFKFATRADHGGCIGAIVKKEVKTNGSSNTEISDQASESSVESSVYEGETSGGAAASVTSFFQRAAKAARDIKNSAQSGLSSPAPDDEKYIPMASVYSGSTDKSPVFHQFLDCVYQILRQHPSKFEFNSRFLKRLFYHYYSCQYGTFLCDSERELYQVFKVHESTVSVWDYFNSRPGEFVNAGYKSDDVIFFNFADVKWWSELYGRTDEEMNGLSNSLDRKFAQMSMNRK